MKDILKTLGKGTLVTLLVLSLGGLGWAAQYIVGEHLNADEQQSKDIKQLTLTVTKLAEAVDTLKDVTKAHQEDLKMIRKDTSEQLAETQRLINRLTIELDRLNQNRYTARSGGEGGGDQ